MRRYETAASAGARCARRAILYPVRNIDPARERVQGSSLRCFVFRNVVRYESQFYVQSCAQYAHKHALWYLLAASSFSPAAFIPARPATAVCSTVGAAEVDWYGNSLIVKKAFESAQESNLLQAVYDSKLLSRAEAAGVTLKSLEPVLAIASKNPEVLVLVESAGPDVYLSSPPLSTLPPALSRCSLHPLPPHRRRRPAQSRRRHPPLPVRPWIRRTRDRGAHRRASVDWRCNPRR